MNAALLKVEDAWSLFWADPAQSRCAAGAPGIWHSLRQYWSSFAATLPAHGRVLDLGCGAGVVGRLLLSVRPDLHVTGVDAARVPRADHAHLDLRSGIAMEALPFEARSFCAVVSQFGYEYSNVDASAREVARVLAPDAKLAFLVHHAESSIVTTTRAHQSAVVAFLAEPMRAAFCGGDAPAFNSRISLLVQQYPDDTLIAELARALPNRLGWMTGKRLATWASLEDALAPECRISDSLETCCVAPARIETWVEPLRDVSSLAPITVLREANGDPIAWRIEHA